MRMVRYQPPWILTRQRPGALPLDQAGAAGPRPQFFCSEIGIETEPSGNNRQPALTVQKIPARAAPTTAAARRRGSRGQSPRPWPQMSSFTRVSMIGFLLLRPRQRAARMRPPSRSAADGRARHLAAPGRGRRLPHAAQPRRRHPDRDRLARRRHGDAAPIHAAERRRLHAGHGQPGAAPPASRFALAPRAART